MGKAAGFTQDQLARQLDELLFSNVTIDQITDHFRGCASYVTSGLAYNRKRRRANKGAGIIIKTEQRDILWAADTTLIDRLKSAQHSIVVIKKQRRRAVLQRQQLVGHSHLTHLQNRELMVEGLIYKNPSLLSPSASPRINATEQVEVDYQNRTITDPVLAVSLLSEHRSPGPSRVPGNSPAAYLPGRR